MCCFSRPVSAVTDTNIFARAAKEGRQFLVYNMQLDAKEELAMILPLPVPPNPKEDAVRFINLEKYPDFFVEMNSGFPPPPPSRTKDGAVPPPNETLKVVEVGSFVASFVPTQKDFSRLDPRFRLPDNAWDQIPVYKDYGFAVFQLKKGKQKVHPMAFEFPRRDPQKLFFPTVHIHDGKWTPQARFHHALFCQKSGGEDVAMWEESQQPVGLFMKKAELSQGILDAEGHCYRVEIKGVRKNEDHWV
jgi:hypothetical protein